MEGRGQELQAETQSESGQQTDESLTEHSPNCTQAFWKDKARTQVRAILNSFEETIRCGGLRWKVAAGRVGSVRTGAFRGILRCDVIPHESWSRVNDQFHRGSRHTRGDAGSPGSDGASPEPHPTWSFVLPAPRRLIIWA
jgi:hypothetical protein